MPDDGIELTTEAVDVFELEPGHEAGQSVIWSLRHLVVGFDEPLDDEVGPLLNSPTANCGIDLMLLSGEVIGCLVHGARTGPRLSVGTVQLSPVGEPIS